MAFLLLMELFSAAARRISRFSALQWRRQLLQHPARRQGKARGGSSKLSVWSDTALGVRRRADRRVRSGPSPPHPRSSFTLHFASCPLGFYHFICCRSLQRFRGACRVFEN